MNEIDVTKCRYYRFGFCYAEPNYIGIFKGYDKCNKHEDCYYKKLQQLKEDYAELLNRHNASFDNFQQLKAENEELKNKLDYCFEDNSSNYDKFCDICVAKDTCNGNCCYNQIKDMLGYEI